MDPIGTALIFAAGAALGAWAGWSVRGRIGRAEMAGKTAEAAARLEAEKALHAQALAEMGNRFKALSADVLKESRDEFLRQAETAFARHQQAAGTDLDKRREAIQGMLKPLEEQLKTYQARLQQGESAQARTLGEVSKQLETLTRNSQTLATETQQFRMVLHSSQARGKWGEETLRRVAESAGMSAHCDFTEQASAEETRPDLIVRLPGDRMIIVDAKVPDFNAADVQGLTDPQNRAAALAEHAKKLRTTIRQLASRNYPVRFPGALDYVVLFLPAESLFSAALEGDPDLIVWAAEQRIMLATPASLIALLRAVSLSWQQFAQTENARAIAREAADLFGRVEKFTEHVSRIGASLDKACAAYRDAAGSYDRRIRPSGDRLSKLLGRMDALPELKGGETAPAPAEAGGDKPGTEAAP